MYYKKRKIGIDVTMRLFFISVFLFVFIFASGCSTPSWFPTKASWFPIKKKPPYKAKMKELVDKEVIIIDKEEYVKVQNPKTSEGGNQPKYLYIHVNEFLSTRGTYTPISPIIPKEEAQKGSSVVLTKPSSSLKETDVVSVSPNLFNLQDLKIKVMITHFDDRTSDSDELFGDWGAEKLIKEVNQKSQRIIFVDYEMVKEFLKNKGIVFIDLETPMILQLLNEVFGIHALVIGHLSGPYVFTTKAGKEQDEIASAIIKIDMKIVDTLSGKTLKNLSATNPVLATKEKGTFSEEKAKEKAIELTIGNLSRSLISELDSLEWFCRIAKVEGNDVYINAGRLTGLKVGDVMEVFRPGRPGEKGEIRGKIKISACFGIDASMGRLIQGNQPPNINDILKLAKTI
jgi:hypothetical protein